MHNSHFLINTRLEPGVSILHNDAPTASAVFPSRAHTLTFMKRIMLQILVLCAFLAVIHSDKPKTRESAQYWSAMAETYLVDGSCEGAFTCYEDCIAEGTADAAILYEFGELLLCSQEAAKEFYGEDTQQIFDRAFLLFRRALEADPMNWELAANIARNHNVVQLWRPEEAFEAWERALSLSTTEDQREEVWLNLARAQFRAGRNAEALESLGFLHSPEYDTFKGALTAQVDQQMRSRSTTYRRSL
jgi:Tfp pilus assembly protein PilF